MNDWPTDYLVESPSFISGAASVLDLMGVYPAYNKSDDAAIADAKALLNDWYNVGDDFRKVIASYDEKK